MAPATPVASPQPELWLDCECVQGRSKEWLQRKCRCRLIRGVSLLPVSRATVMKMRLDQEGDCWGASVATDGMYRESSESDAKEARGGVEMVEEDGLGEGEEDQAQNPGM